MGAAQPSHCNGRATLLDLSQVLDLHGKKGICPAFGGRRFECEKPDKGGCIAA
jgi:hypothetical protein